MLYIRISLLVLFLAACSSLFAQEADTIEVIRVERYQGLEERNRINDIFTDSYDRKWIATNKGTYSIHSFYSPADTINEKASNAIAQDEFGQVIFGYANLEVSYLKAINTISITSRNDNASLTALEYYEGNIWVGSTEGIFVVSPEGSKILKHYTQSNSKLPSNQLNSLYADDNGILWAGTDNGVCRISGTNWKVYEKGFKFTGICSTKEGTWLASEREMWLVDNWNRWYPAAVNKKLSKGMVTSLTSDSRGKIYIASDILVQFDPYDNSIRSFDEEDGFVNTEFLSLQSDGQDNIWVGTANQGLYRLEVTTETTNKLTALAFVSKSLDCHGDSDAVIQVKAEGGDAPYLYEWLGLDIRGPVAENLSAGKYLVNVMDASGMEIPLEVNVPEPSPIEVEVMLEKRISDKGMRDGKAEISIRGGSPGYKISWENGATTNEVRRLAQGQYKVLVTDEKGCSANAVAEIKKESAVPELKIETIEVGQTLSVNELYFEADSSVITNNSFEVLNEVYDFLTDNPGVQIEIGGHTNNIPEDAYCFKLSTERAQNVADYLYRKGISEKQVSYHGYGKTTPIASNLTEAGRKRNQRVEIKILDIAEN